MIMYREEINLRENQDEMDRARLKIFRQGLELDLLKSRMAEMKQASLEPSNPIQCLAQILMSKEMSDITIIIPGHDENFKVHRLVLSMWSIVFQAMLFGPMAEGDTITLAEDPPEAFSWLLTYMYTGDTELSSVELALQVYLLANKYFLEHLKTVCSKYLLTKVNAVNVPEILNVSNLLGDEALISKCTQALEESPDSFFSSPTIGLMSSESLEQLLKKDLPVSSESVIYKGVLTWSRKQLETKEKEISTALLRQEAEKFLPQIRFLIMSLEEFAKHVLPNTILTVTEISAIQLNIAGVPDVSLPPIFSNIKEKRKHFVKSKLEKCRITKAACMKDCEGLTTISNPVILDEIQSVNIIYLRKLEYVGRVGFHGSTLKVYDSSGQELRAVHFDGRASEFYVPIQMKPEEKYTFTLSGGGSDKGYEDIHEIEDNGLISGRIMNNFLACDFHYWK